MSSPTFTGRGSRRQTRRSVRVAERLARVLISTGGLGTILAVALILVFLTWVVVPLFRGAGHELRSQADLEEAPGKLLLAGVDEYRHFVYALDAEGNITVRLVADGSVVDTRPIQAGALLTAVSTRSEAGEIAFGFADGNVRLGRIGFRTSFLDAEEEAALGQEVAAGSTLLAGNALVERTREGQLRAHRLDLDVGEPIDLGLSGRVVALDRSEGHGTTTMVALDEQGKLVVSTIGRRENLLTGEVTIDVDDHEIAWRERPPGLPARVLLSGAADTAYLVWPDGILQRYDVRDPENAGLAEELDLVDGPGELTALVFLIGKTTLVSGDSRGRVLGWFGTRAEEGRTRDGVALQNTHRLQESGAAITALSPSARSRVLAAGSSDGAVRMYHVTSHKLLFETQPDDHDGRAGGSVTGLAIAPKDDGLVALVGPRLRVWDMQLRHPEATLGALFTPVWYEGYAKPEHVWQSTGGTDDFEPKLGLWPLVFGTIKATFYSMLFGVPIALMAAIFTSEFLHKRLRTPLKSLTEMMASLPSVVLGFIAAIIIAPIVQGILPTVLALFFTIPVALLLGASLWQMLPARAYVKWSGMPRFLAICLALPVGVLLAVWLGPWMERAFFAGDIMAWLSEGRGSSVGGWMLLLLPLSASICALFAARVVGPRLRAISAGWSRGHAGRVDLGKLALGLGAVFGLALALSHAFDGLGFDPRGGVLDTYVQRNALIVGFVMAFAIIPIVYTLAEDALSSVPAHLRLASLGAGATPWQTAARVVVPTAMSGLFSAVMIGLGRAVGETMIVLMATGNTPVTSWNVFDGFRTLSANIAVELPEAVRDSTHYRTLFLAAFCLFALTFVLNTLAEVVRQRFRRRAYQL